MVNYEKRDKFHLVKFIPLLGLIELNGLFFKGSFI